MLRAKSAAPMLNFVRERLIRRFRRRWLRSELYPVRIERMASPQVRLLEPRFVLNATAELNVMGQLLVMGTQAAESVELQVDSNGDLLLRDGDTSNAIPIANHPDGPGGSTNPLDPSAVTSGQVIFDMGDGNDLLNLQLPSGLDVEVRAGGGDDDTNLRFSTDGTAKSNLIQVASERVTLDPSASPLISIADDTVRLTGDVDTGVVNALTQLDVGAGSFQVDGQLILNGDVLLTGEGTVDLSNAVITASTSDASLRVDLQPQTGSDFLLGGADASGGQLVENVAITSANSVSIGPLPFSLAGDFLVRNVPNATEFDSSIDADSVSVETQGDLTVNGAVRTLGGEIMLSSSESLTIAGDLNSALQNSPANIALFGQSVHLIDTQITTAGGLIGVSGPVVIGGDVGVDSGNALMADSAGHVQFFDTVEGDDAIADTLRIDARGANLDGSVRFARPVGGSSMLPGAVDLSGLDVQAGQIEVDTIGVRGGEVRLSADVIRLLGREIRTASAGEIVVDGDLLLPTGDIRITAADGARFTSSLKGQLGTRDLSVTAGTDALFEGRIVDVRNLNVIAKQLASFADDVFLSGDLAVEADVIRIAGDVNTTLGSPDGDIRLDGVTLISAENDAVLFAGDAMIQLDAAGGVIDVGQATLRSDAAGDAITIRDASRVVLGNVFVENGNLAVGIGQDVRGPLSQSQGSAMVVDRLTFSTDGAIELTNSDNEIRLIERIISGGEISIADSTGDLTVTAVDSAGNDVLLSTTGSMFLAERAIMATAAVTTLTAGRGIFDRDNTTVINVQTGQLQLNAGAEGIGEPANPVDVDVSIRVSASTAAADGNIDIAHVDGALPIGFVDASGGDVNLVAQTINDAANDSLTDIVARRLTMTADQGIGNIAELELLSVSELTAVTDSGGIDLDLTATGATIVRQLTANTGNILIQHRGLVEDLPVELRSVLTVDGAITIETGGTMTARSVVSQNVNGIDDPGAVGGPLSRDVSLIARGVQSDVLVESVTALQGADVLLVAGDDIFRLQSPNSTPLIADDLQLVSRNQSGDWDVSVDLVTNVNDLQAAVTENVLGNHRGDLLIAEVDSIRLAASDAQDDEIIETANGQVVISAADTITVVDTSVGDDGDDLKADPEIVARNAENGRIDLQAVTRIELHDHVQLQSQKITRRADPILRVPETRLLPDLEAPIPRQDRSIFMQSDAIVLGQDIELSTGQLDSGQAQGVARIFSPRPPDREPGAPGDASDSDSAFFDPSSPRTNILEQAIVNDATGILTFDIGQQGERGLTVDVDWGAPTRRFQQVNGLSADQAIFVGVNAVGEPTQPITSNAGLPLLSVEHFYTEADILNSRENGRDSATDPIEVRFSVRHHESIFVIGNTVQQGPKSELNQVPGGIVSSTDDPTTPREMPDGLENGKARFVIPPLSIPVAFFPVREVIPEIETREFVVRREFTFAVKQTMIETIESTSTSLVGREEYFRIRAISPDPNGVDRAVERLPDNILEGDNLRELFAKLPDGRYEIQYVLSDANVRSILQVDVRDGKATIPSEELDEGLLELVEGTSEQISENEKSEMSSAESDEASNEDPKKAPGIKSDEQPDEELDLKQLAPEQPVPDQLAPEQPVQELPSPETTAVPLTRETRASTLPAVSTGIVLASALRRRVRGRGRKRLSVAGRFAANAAARPGDDRVK